MMKTTRLAENWLVVGFAVGTVLLAAAVARARTEAFSPVEHARRTIYHSPQTPGFTSWVGAWTMPDGSLMVCFTQATGPVEGRPQAPRDVQHRLTWPPPGHPGYDMTGLDLRNVHLRSCDGGKTWSKVSADAFQSCMNGVTGEAQTALADGTILRGVWGYYLPYNPELPKTGYLERSSDGTKTWGKPELLLDPKKYSAWPKRIRVLRDGRLILIGGVADVPANSRTRAEYNGLFEPLVLVSSDQGKTWKGPIPVVPAQHRRNWGGEEFDAAELPNGDLLCVFRRVDPSNRGREVRWQGVLQRTGDAWTPGEVGPAPFPHSGHPELLATREGPILHVATSGIHWTLDAGKSWRQLDVPGTAYYPRSVQAADGRIFVFGHVGGDDAYGKSDQAIVMDSFRLASLPREALGRQLEKYYGPPAEHAGKYGPYRSPLRFADGTLVKSPQDWARRRQEILALWHHRLGSWPPLLERPTVKRLESVERDGYVQHHVLVQVSPEGNSADGYLWVPVGPGPFPAVLVPFYEPLTSIGQGTKGRGTHDYGFQLVRRGFVTLSIGTPGSVEKIGSETRQLLVEAGVRSQRQPLTLLAYAAANCHTVLAQTPKVDPSRIGIIGLSYGGKWSMFASCLYDKFACAVWSDPGIVFDEKNPSVNYWEPWYLGYDPKTQRKPGVPSPTNPRTGLYKELIEAGEDLVDLHALMAPRPVLVSGGTEDPPRNWQALNHLVAVNELLGYKGRVAMTARPTHVPTPKALELELAFLEYWLQSNAK